MFIYFEKLTIPLLVGSLIPLLLKNRRTDAYKEKSFYFYSTPQTLKLASKLLSLMGVTLERLDFQIHEVLDEKGLSLQLSSIYHNLIQFQKRIFQSEAYSSLSRKEWYHSRLGKYLEKSLVLSTSPSSLPSPTWKTVFMIETVNWHRRSNNSAATAILYLTPKYWEDSFKKFAEELGIRLIIKHSIIDSINIKNYFFSRPEFLRLAKKIRSLISQKKGSVSDKINQEVPKIAVPITRVPEIVNHSLYSDLFFWQQSGIPAKNILLSVHQSRMDVTKEKWDAVQTSGFSLVSHHSKLTTAPAIPVFHGNNKKCEPIISAKKNSLRSQHRKSKGSKVQPSAENRSEIKKLNFHHFLVTCDNPHNYDLLLKKYTFLC